jgi:hypothetical protein
VFVAKTLAKWCKISGDESMESLLSGEAIRQELRDTNSNLEETVTKCTRKAKAEIKKWVTCWWLHVLILCCMAPLTFKSQS